MPGILTLMLAVSALAASLMFTPISSYAAAYICMGSMLIGGVLLRRRVAAIIRHPAYIAVLASLAFLVATLPFVWVGANDLFLIVALLPVPLGIGLVALVDIEPRFGSPVLLGSLSLIGVIAGTAAAIEDIYVMGIDRAGAGSNPIHFAGVTMMLGFFSLVGLFGTVSRWRWIFLAGPLLGLEAVLLSGTRGAMLGFAVVATLVILLAAFWFRRAWRLLLAFGVAVALLIAAFPYAMPGAYDRLFSAVDDTRSAISAYVAGEGIDGPAPGIDYSTDQRLALIRGAVGILVDNPVFGVGAGQVIPEAQKRAPERYKDKGSHLHSDPGDFAAAAGAFGLIAYVLLLAAPFLRPAGNYGRDIRRAMTLGAVVLSGSVLTLGLTNAVLGVLPQTMLFGTLLAAIVAMGRTAGADSQPAQQ